MATDTVTSPRSICCRQETPATATVVWDIGPSLPGPMELLRVGRSAQAQLAGIDVTSDQVEHAEQVERHRKSHEHRIEAVEHTTVAGDERAHVLDPEVTLDP